MKKAFTFTTIAVCALLTACFKTQSDDQKASAQYVKAALESEKAVADIQSFKTAVALGKFRSVAEQIGAITKNYPSSKIALRLVSEKDVSLGKFPVEDISEKIIPALETSLAPELAPVKRAWLVAALSVEPTAAVNVLAEETIKTNALTLKQKESVLVKLPVSVRLPAEKKAEAKNTQPRATETASPSSSDCKKLLAEARKAARFTDISKADEILAISEKIGASGGGEFAEILKAAIAKASTISVASLREKSYAILAAAAANSANYDLAIQTLSQINSSAALESVFPALAKTLGRTDKYPATLSVISKITNAQKRDDLTAMLAENMAARKTSLKAAGAIAAQISDVKKRNAALAKIAAAAYRATENAVFMASISKIDISNLDCLAEFAEFSPEKINAKSQADNLANLARMTLPFDKKIAAFLNAKAAEKFDVASLASKTVIDNFTALGNFAQAKKFALAQSPQNAFDLDVSITLRGAEAGDKGEIALLKTLAEKASHMAATQRVKTAFAIETAKIPADIKDAVISNLLKIGNK